MKSNDNNDDDDGADEARKMRYKRGRGHFKLISKILTTGKKKIKPQANDTLNENIDTDMHLGTSAASIASAAWKMYVSFPWLDWTEEYPDDAATCYAHPLALWCVMDDKPRLDYLTMIAKHHLNISMANIASESAFKDQKYIVPAQRNRLKTGAVTATHFILQDLRKEQQEYYNERKQDYQGVCTRFANYMRIVGFGGKIGM